MALVPGLLRSAFGDPSHGSVVLLSAESRTSLFSHAPLCALWSTTSSSPLPSPRPPSAASARAGLSLRALTGRLFVLMLGVRFPPARPLSSPHACSPAQPPRRRQFQSDIHPLLEFLHPCRGGKSGPGAHPTHVHACPETAGELRKEGLCQRLQDYSGESPGLGLCPALRFFSLGAVGEVVLKRIRYYCRFVARPGSLHGVPMIPRSTGQGSLSPG
ncbi:uncharacterized protein LOC118597708 [Onychomys torridus]|uniref:uncharacterized protein LOC118597708 n=1 Tax=Onychomys torridus TaxID=38674 RepID=UPI00167F8EC5|nr:uncharacterized protein LOC118597708 [Onychomys torridus]